ELSAQLRLDRVQLHGSEPPELIARFAPRVLRGVRDGTVGALPDGVPVVFDRRFGAEPGADELERHWAAAHELTRERPVLLAAALDPARVAEAVRRARPWGVDVARGVEHVPGVKDHDAVRRFVAAAKEVAA